MVFTHKIVCRKSPKLYASYHDQTLQKTCFNLTEMAAFNLPNNTANITNGILILLLAVLPFFIDPQTTLSFQRVITLGLLYIGTRNLIELAATVYFDNQL